MSAIVGSETVARKTTEGLLLIALQPFEKSEVR